MLRRGTMRLARSMMAHIGPRYYSTIHPVAKNDAGIGVGIDASTNFLHENFITGSEKTIIICVRWLSTMNSRNTSTITLNDEKKNEQNGQRKVGSDGSEASATAPNSGGDDNKSIVSYWGIQPPKVTKEDGTPWRWNCFMVRRSYFYCTFKELKCS